MLILRSFVLAAVAALAIGLAGPAAAQTANVMTVRLPGGGLAEIRYTGDVPPQVVFLPGPASYESWMPTSSLFGAASPFAMLERISAEMDRQAAAMFRYAATAARAPSSQLTEVATGIPGSVCMQGVRVTQIGGAPPRVESYSAGNCAPATGPSGAVRAPAGSPKQPDLILTQNTEPTPDAGTVRRVAAAR